MTNYERVVVLGAGKMGSAMGKILSDNQRDIVLWDKDAARVDNQKPLARILPSADALFLCVPSWALRDAIKHVEPYLEKTTIVVSFAKGIDEERWCTLDALLEELLPHGQPLALVGGALLAEELASGLSGAGVIATRERSVFRSLSNMFQGTNLILEYSKDIRGVAAAMVLKNIYAIALGIACALPWSENRKGWLVSRAVEEMGQITEIFGGDRRTVYSVAGLGDLVATGYSPYSRNRRVGEELVTKHTVLQSEGVRSLPPLLHMLGEKKEQLPFLAALETIVVQHQDARIVFEQFAAKSYA